jgi:hypothetical protein
MKSVIFSITTGDGTSSIELNRIVSFPIEAAITTEVSYSQVGTAIANGNLFDGRILWMGGQFLIKPEEYPVLMGLIRRQELQRRNGDDFAIQFDNLLYPFIDPNSTRTRAIAAGTVTTNADGTIQYYARHNVAIVKFSVDRNGSYYTASMDWQELELTP